MRSFLAIGKSLVAGSAMMVLGSAAPAGAQSSADVSDATARANAAQAQADEARGRADELALQGGPAYKSGAMDRVNREAARYQAEADQARDEATGANWAPLAVSPRAAALEDRLDALKQTNGWGQKSGAYRQTQAEIQRLKGPPAPASTTEYVEPVPPSADKPAVKAEHPTE
jgi:hypothetical protein